MSETLASHRDLMKQLGFDCAGIAILSTENKLLEHCGTAPSSEAVAAFNEIAATTAAPMHLEIAGAHWLLTRAHDAVRDESCRVAAAVEASNATDAGRREQVCALLALAGRNWLSESSLNAELNVMAEELAARYEELNMAFGKEEQANRFEEGQAALRTLVRDTADYLEVALALLYVPRKRIMVQFSLDEQGLPDRALVASHLENELYPWIEQNARSVVITELADRTREAACPSINYKLAACPLYDERGGVEGMIVAVNHRYKDDFTNSDRNLLEVLARKASKIIGVNYDGLTGLMNRQGLEYFVENALGSAIDKDISHCVLHLDINRLHVLNEITSHERGNEVIREVASLLINRVRESDVVARLSGGSFGVLLENCPVSHGQRVAETLRDAVAEIRVQAGKHEMDLSVSIGVLVMDASSKNVQDILKHAEASCAAAKELGQGQVQVYAESDADLQLRQEQMQWVAGIQSAIRHNRLELFCQEVRPLQEDDGLPAHYEILLRMHDEDGSFVSPGAFLPAAERYHMMPAIDRWVVENSLEALCAAFPQMSDQTSTWAINLSGQSIGYPDFLQFLLTAIGERHLPPKRIGFEVTETVALEDMKGAIHFMNSIRELGCDFSLDDFGTGLSSFTYLKALPVDYLKIDGSFVKGIMDDHVSHVMVSSIHQVGQAMGLKNIAEFVESEQILNELREMGLHYGQGYAIAKPRPLSKVLEELRA